jgi:hypothetical protein
MADIDATAETQDTARGGGGVGCRLAHTRCIGQQTAKRTLALLGNTNESLLEEVDVKLADNGVAADTKQVVHLEGTEVGHGVALPVNDAVAEVLCNGDKRRVLFRLAVVAVGRVVLGWRAIAAVAAIPVTAMVAVTTAMIAVLMAATRLWAGTGAPRTRTSADVGHDRAGDRAIGDALTGELNDDDASEGLVVVRGTGEGRELWADLD